MKKIKVEKKVFSKSVNTEIRWKDIKDFEFEDDDIIRYNNFFGDYYFEVVRLIEETDEEFNRRVEKENKRLENSKKERYERYLALKKEFEGVQGPDLNINQLRIGDVVVKKSGKPFKSTKKE